MATITLHDMNEGIYRAMFENAAVGITRVNLDGLLVDVNQKFCDMLGYAPHELIGIPLSNLTHPADFGAGAEMRSQLIHGKAVSATGEKRFLHRNGGIIWGRRTMSMVRDENGDPAYVISIVEDITERKLTDERQAIEHAITRLLADAHTIAEVMPSVIQALAEGLGYVYGARWEVKPGATKMHCSESWCVADPAIEAFRQKASARVETPGQSVGLNRRVWATIAPVWIEDVGQELFLARREAALQAGLHSAFAFPILVGGSFYGDLEMFAREVCPRDERALEIAHTAGNQIGQFIARKQAEAALRESEERFRALTELSSDWYWEQDADFRFTAVSRGIFESTGNMPEFFIGKRRWEISAAGLSDAEWEAHKAKLEAHQPFQDLEYGRMGAHGQIHYLSIAGEPVFDQGGNFAGYRGIGKDITQRKIAENSLQAAHEDLTRKSIELKRSNTELEQFAYVASHDLQEPLRMISSYTQMLLRRYGDRFDSDAKEFMDFVVDGAARMKLLIEDLLAYSRIGTRGKEFQPTDCGTVYRKTMVNLRAVLDSSGAMVTCDPLPELMADELQLVQLFQNLIGNAIKFRGADAPRIHIGVEERNGQWVFSFKDNGIGIEPQYFERIFLMFQRLHGKVDYPGTGIGLAICKKVIDRHGGRIWIESQPGCGSTFYFSLPKMEARAHD